MKILSYNILSNKWAIYKENDPSTHKLKNRYSFIPEDERNILLSWDNRLTRLLAKIKEYNADIICLQEVDLETIQEDFIDNFPEYNNFHHTIWNKDTNKDSYKRVNTIGNITFWKNDKLNCITCPNNAVNSCAIFTELVHIHSKFTFLLINVHLKAGLDSCKVDRGYQLKSCCKKIKSTVPTCIVGDFNEELDVNSPDNTITFAKDILDKYNFVIYPSQITCDVYWHETKTHYYHAFDHVVTCNLDVIISSCPPPHPLPNNKQPSDHFPLLFNIII